jgi:hypothetical protein
VTCVTYAIMAVSSAYRASSTWREGTGMSFKYRLKSTGKTSPPCAISARIYQRVDVAVRKAASKVLLWRYEDIILTRENGKFRAVNLKS